MCVSCEVISASAMLYDVDFNNLADIRSGPFDVETSREPNINNTSSVQRRYYGHNDRRISFRKV